MNRTTILATILVAVIALGAGYWIAREQRQPSTLGPANMIAFTLPDTEGNNRSIEDWKGKVVLLNFWATWCPPCREEVPTFVELQNQYGPRGFQIIGVAIDKKEDVADFMDTFFVNYPILLGNDKTLKLMDRYGNRIGSLPYSVIMDRNGKIMDRKIGAYHKDQVIKVIEPLI